MQGIKRANACLSLRLIIQGLPTEWMALVEKGTILLQEEASLLWHKQPTRGTTWKPPNKRSVYMGLGMSDDDSPWQVQEQQQQLLLVVVVDLFLVGQPLFVACA